MLLQMAQGTSADGGIGRVDSAVRSQQRTIDDLSEQRALNQNNEERLSGVTDEISGLKDEAAEAVIAKEAAQADAKKKADDLNNLISTKDAAEKTISDNKDKTEKQLEDERAEQDRLAKKVRDWEKEQEKKGNFVYGDGVLANPAKGFPITSQFGYRIHPITGNRKLHTGTDFGVPAAPRSARPVTASSSPRAGPADTATVSSSPTARSRASRSPRRTTTTRA